MQERAQIKVCRQYPPGQLHAAPEQPRPISIASRIFARQVGCRAKPPMASLSPLICAFSHRMTLRHRWKNEQKCCSFLRMTSHVQEGKTLAEVQVNCPPDLSHEITRTFGLNSEQ
jgi:hypothetical protein